jgi:2-hydroxychromene-2-carboxylate isomerase
LTISAHRLIAKAYEIGGPAAQAAVITPIFRAYHEDELDINDPEVLADAAEQANIMSREEVSVSRVRCQRLPEFTGETLRFNLISEDYGR